MSTLPQRAPEHHPDTFGERLRHLREAAGLTQEMLAAEAGLSANAIGALERGDRRHPYPRTIQVLASVLGLSDDERERLVSLIPRRGGTALKSAPEVGLLPVPTNSLLGREDLVEQAIAFLRRPARLLTMTGPGGVGKTRLALRVAAEWQDDLADGARIVSLVSVADPEVVATALAQGLGLRTPGQAEPRDALIAWLRQREMLLVIDNFEQVAAASPLISDLLSAAPGLQVIVTSRVSLRIDGEQEFPVPPLPLPGHVGGRSLEELAAEPAVALFLRQAQAVRPDVALSEDNAAAIVEICRRLEGLPLAIELAAARSKLLSPQAMVEQLGESLHLLIGGGADRPSRLQTMRQAIAWSYDLLGPAEQHMFRCLSVFEDGCMLDAVGPVAGEGTHNAEVVALVSTLVDHSLLLREEFRGGDVRVRMLEVIREFGAERLEAHGEAAMAREAHAAWYLNVAATARPQIEGPLRWSAHQTVRRDLGNLQSALDWLLATGDAERSHRLANELARFWINFGFISEGRRWLDRVLALPDTVNPGTRAEALYWAAGFANLQDDRASGLALADRAIAIACQHGSAWHKAMALTMRAGALAPTAPDRARPLFEQALSLFRQAGDPIQEGIALKHLGMLGQRRGASEEAARYHADALAIWRRLDHPWGVPSTLRDQAQMALGQHNPTLAWVLYRESLVRWQALGERMHMSDCLAGLAHAAHQMDRHDIAAMLLGAEDELNASMGFRPPQRVHEDVADAVASALGLETFETIRVESAMRPLASVIDEVLAVPVPQPKG